uniref:Uncharacterized protein n=1 Tax=Opuntia streptacantha TaxID=393608 RepID=A0A7C8Z1T1_OPUST
MPHAAPVVPGLTADQSSQLVALLEKTNRQVPSTLSLRKRFSLPKVGKKSQPSPSRTGQPGTTGDLISATQYLSSFPPPSRVGGPSELQTNSHFTIKSCSKTLNSNTERDEKGVYRVWYSSRLCKRRNG